MNDRVWVMPILNFVILFKLNDKDYYDHMCYILIMG